MEERRRVKRTDLKATILIKRLDGSETHEASIDVTDVSKSGIGFYCHEPLTIQSVYESYLTIWTKEVLHAFIQIVRIEQIGNKEYHYGAIFVGMSEMDASRIEVYQTVSDNVK